MGRSKKRRLPCSHPVGWPVLLAKRLHGGCALCAIPHRHEERVLLTRTCGDILCCVGEVGALRAGSCFPMPWLVWLSLGAAFRTEGSGWHSVSCAPHSRRFAPEDGFAGGMREAA